jgi:aminoglycoside phosphotransferase (APT) family kinase protein
VTPELTAEIEALARERRLTGLALIGSGLEFDVFHATAPDGKQLVLRTPIGGRFQSHANDPHVDARSLLRWEYAVSQHLAELGFPVAAPRELLPGEPDVLVTEYVPDDGGGCQPEALGALLRSLHQAPLPTAVPPAAEGLPTAQLLPVRIARRWREVAALVPDLPAGLPPAQLTAVLTRAPGKSLLHLDVRAPNLRCRDGRVLALLDWSNALIGDPLLELARLAEFAQVAENGIDFPAVQAGYGPVAHWHQLAYDIYRLDAAVMLTLVFWSEAPDATLGESALDRLLRVHHMLERELRP